jgi:hypothetical protein
MADEDSDDRRDEDLTVQRSVERPAAVCLAEVRGRRRTLASHRAAACERVAAARGCGAAAPGTWRRIEASVAKAATIVTPMSPKYRVDPPDSSAHDPTAGLSTPPIRPTATAVPTPVARTAVG